MMTRDEFLKLAQAIAEHLNGWTVQARDRWDFAVVFTNAKEILSFHLAFRSHNQRLSVRPNYNGLHQFLPYQAQSISITISSTRPPANIAADIARRFLPKFKDEMRGCRLAAANHQAQIDLSKATAAELIAASGRLFSQSNRRNDDDVTIRLNGAHSVNQGQHCHLTAEVYKDKVSLTLRSLPADLANKIAATIAAHLSTQPTNQPTN